MPPTQEERLKSNFRIDLMPLLAGFPETFVVGIEDYWLSIIADLRKEWEEKSDKERWCSECEGCVGGHPSFWKSVTESPQWKLWSANANKEMLYDIAEVEECGWISAAHFQDFLEFKKAFDRTEWVEEARREIAKLPNARIDEVQNEIVVSTYNILSLSSFNPLPTKSEECGALIHTRGFDGEGPLYCAAEKPCKLHPNSK